MVLLETLENRIGANGSTTWTPSWTNLTVGNGTVTAKYTKIGKTVVARLNMVFGNTTSVGGAVSISLPVTSVTYAGQAGTIPISAQAVMWDASGTAYDGIVTWSNTTTAGIKIFNTAGTYSSITTLSSTVPFTWTTSDEISLTIIYEAA